MIPLIVDPKNPNVSGARYFVQGLTNSIGSCEFPLECMTRPEVLWCAPVGIPFTTHCR